MPRVGNLRVEREEAKTEGLRGWGLGAGGWRRELKFTRRTPSS